MIFQTDSTKEKSKKMTRTETPQPKNVLWLTGFCILVCFKNSSKEEGRNMLCNILLLIGLTRHTKTQCFEHWSTKHLQPTILDHHGICNLLAGIKKINSRHLQKRKSCQSLVSWHRHTMQISWPQHVTAANSLLSVSISVHPQKPGASIFYNAVFLSPYDTTNKRFREMLNPAGLVR